MDIGLMVESQNGLSWERWSHILALAERLGFPSLFCSDHYFIGTQRQSLDPYLACVLAAKETRRLRFGPLVTPVTFRAPVNVGRMAALIDVLSGGRFVMGLGAGWNEAEHRAYGVSFPPVKERFDRLEEAINLLQALWGPGPATYRGRYYRIEGVDCLPKPSHGGPPLLIGGSGERRTLRQVAQYAAEWNCVNMAPAAYAHKKAILEEHCAAVKREPGSIRRSMMVFALIGPTPKALDRVTRRYAELFAPARELSLEEVRKRAKVRGMIVGQTEEVVDQLGRLAELGVQEVQFQHLDFDSDEVPEYLAAEIVPAVATL